MDRADTSFLVALDDVGQIVGTASMRVLDTETLMLDRLYVDPDAQGEGIGSALLDACLTAFPDAAVVRLEVEPANTVAVAYYERRGFTIPGRTDDCGSSGDDIPAIVMTLHRPRPV